MFVILRKLSTLKPNFNMMFASCPFPTTPVDVDLIPPGCRPPPTMDADPPLPLDAEPLPMHADPLSLDADPLPPTPTPMDADAPHPPPPRTDKHL